MKGKRRIITFNRVPFSLALRALGSPHSRVKIKMEVGCRPTDDRGRKLGNRARATSKPKLFDVFLVHSWSARRHSILVVGTGILALGRGNNGRNLVGDGSAVFRGTEATSNERTTDPGRQDRREVELDRSVSPALELLARVHQVLNASRVNMRNSRKVKDDGTQERLVSVCGSFIDFGASAWTCTVYLSVKCRSVPYGAVETNQGRSKDAR